jgi:hypothetical protein
VEQIQLYTDSIGVVYSGMGPDSRVLVRMGQKKAAKYRLQYGVRCARAPRGRHVLWPPPTPRTHTHRPVLSLAHASMPP